MNRGSGEMSEKRHKNAKQSGFDMTVSVAHRIRETSFVQSFLAFLAGSPDEERYFLKEKISFLQSAQYIYLFYTVRTDTIFLMKGKKYGFF